MSMLQLGSKFFISCGNWNKIAGFYLSFSNSSLRYACKPSVKTTVHCSAAAGRAMKKYRKGQTTMASYC